MTAFVLTYDVRASNHDYTRLYALLTGWNAAHLQNSVWLADLKGPASAIRDLMRTHMHTDDTLSVIQLAQAPDWATLSVRDTGSQWLKAHRP